MPTRPALLIPVWAGIVAASSVLGGGMLLAWDGRGRIADIDKKADSTNSDIARVDAKLEAARAAGVRERELLRERSDAADREHAAQISALQLSQQQTGAFIAATSVRLDNMAGLLDEIKQIVQQRVPQPQTRQTTIPGWSNSR